MMGSMDKATEQAAREMLRRAQELLSASQEPEAIDTPL